MRVSIAVLMIAFILGGCDRQPQSEPAQTPAKAPQRTAEKPETGPGDSQARPKINALRTFGDWTVGCDNVKHCTMASLGAEFSADFPLAHIAIMREAGPAGALTVQVAAFSDEISPALLRADNGAQAVIRDGQAVGGDALVQQLVNAQWLEVLDQKNKAIAKISLRGTSASLRFIDAEQGRAGGVTAIVARGAKPASDVPAAPSLPTIIALRPDGQAAVPPEPMIKEMRDAAGCETDSAAGRMPIETFAAGGDATLVLVPCSAGAYNLSSAVFVLKSGKAEPASFDAPMDVGETNGMPYVVNGYWRDGVLGAYAKGRGLGDCGIAQQFVWDGRQLRLIEQSEMGECRGNPKYITLWRANVVRK